MLKRSGILVLIIFAYFLSGCATVQMASKEEDLALKEFNPPPSDKAGLYIFRSGSLLGSAIKKAVYVDSIVIGETAKGVFFYIEINPGLHSLSTESEFGENSITIEAEGGKNYFAEQYMKVGVFSGGAGIEMVSEDVGKKGVLDCELAERRKF